VQTQAWALRTRLPEDEYLSRIGLLAYMISSLEELLLFDLPRLQKRITPQLNVERLARKTTHDLGAELVKYASQCGDQEVARYLAAGGLALQEVTPQRNAVFHARPATDTEGRIRLYPWRLPEAHFIDEAWLDRVFERLDELQRELNNLRPGFSAS
jgi:hypothetical protein